MKAVALFWSFLVGCLAFMAWAGGGMKQQGVIGSLNVRLQTSMPTSPQTGNANVSGNITAGDFQGDGGLLTNLNGTAITQGIVAAARGGTGLNTSATATGSLLYTSGSGTWSTLAPDADSKVLTLAAGVPTWANAPGVVLPFTGSANVASPNAVFKLTNITTTNGTTLWCENSGTNGIGVYSNNSATTGFAYASQFFCASPDGRCVFASNSATTGAGFAGRFGTASGQGTAIYATASATASVDRTIGVTGQSDNFGAGGGFGVYGVSTASFNPGYGVYGQTSSSAGYGVFSGGRTGASGTKSFRIDYPNDPENRYLSHYSAESPEVLNIYRGNVVLNSGGNAVVQMPSYFAMINKNPSYQLTAVGAAMPNLHIEVEINELNLTRGAAIQPGKAAPTCSFTIAGGVPGKKVSWEVKAVRNDRWVQKNGAPVESDKPGIERGTYQHPELYGQPSERGMTYDAVHQEPTIKQTGGR